MTPSASSTTPTDFVPVLPENAPFTPEQRAYLNGFLAGLFSRAPGLAPHLVHDAAPAQALQPVTILFGSQTGNAEALAKRLAKAAGRRGFAPTVCDMAQYERAGLTQEQNLLLITSTYGDGEPPDNARAFWEFLGNNAAPKLAKTRFAVCALGDTNYPMFCGFGKAVDARLESLGARRVHPRADCDLEFEEPFAQWLDGALNALTAGAASSNSPQPLTPAAALSEGERENPRQSAGVTSAPGKSDDQPLPSPLPLRRGEGQGEGERGAVRGYSRADPFPAALVTNRILNGPGSAKEIRHFEIALDGSGLTYEVGDVLGVIPTNCGDVVEEVLTALKFSGDETVPGRDGADVPLREALLRHYEITRIPQPFLAAIAERSGDESLRKLAAPGTNGELTKFLWGREIIDLLLAQPAAEFNPAEFVGLLRKLQPRLYSIASSPKAHPGQVHLTVNTVRYESYGRRRKGICSTFLADRVTAEMPVPVFVHTNKNFRPPPGGDTPMIMVGPGTGLAPFRAFLEERRAVGAKGRNWLFFGDQRAATDFMYRDQLEAMLREGTLTHLHTAFSRDQAEKIYVQHRLLENAEELFAWLEAGAHFYVCGDASRMAKDVEAALQRVVEHAGSKTPDQAAEYVQKMRWDQRYQRDVY
ncbi:MAG: sulfite reductase subunit alpha [Verrucomicrobiota bacterium]